MTLKKVLEALIFASPKPLLTKEILAALKGAGEGEETGEAHDFAKVKEADVLALLAEVQEDMRASDRAFQLVEQVRGWTLVSDPGCAQWVRQLYPEAKPTRLTGPQLETLAIIAYRQPVTRADIEAVRGVAVDGVVQVLLDRSLVKIAGRAEVPGRPLLYETTEYFLQHFGLRNVDELPNSGELRRIPLPTAPVAEPVKTDEAAPAAAESGEASEPAPAEQAPEEAPVEAEEPPAAESAEPAEEAPAAEAEETVEAGNESPSNDTP